QDVNQVGRIHRRGQQRNLAARAKRDQVGRGVQAFGQNHGRHAAFSQFDQELFALYDGDSVVENQFFLAEDLDPGRVYDIQVADQVCRRNIDHGLLKVAGTPFLACDPGETQRLFVVGGQVLNT